MMASRLFSSRWLRISALLLTMVLVIQGCEEDIVDNVTPRADLTFRIFDADDNPVPDARVYLFSSRSAYQAYVTANPDGDPSITPSLDPEDVSLSNANGDAFFTNRQLQTTSFPSGNTFIHTPSPIYFRVIAVVDGVFVTNDGGGDVNHIFTFPDLESGELAEGFAEVFVE